MSLTTLLLMIAGFGLMASGGGLLAYDIYLAGEHRKLLRGELPVRNSNFSANRQSVRIHPGIEQEEFRRPSTLPVARYASLESRNRRAKATGASLPNRKASTAALDRLGLKEAEALGSRRFLPGQRRVPCHPASLVRKTRRGTAAG